MPSEHRILGHSGNLRVWQTRRAVADSRARAGDFDVFGTVLFIPTARSVRTTS